MRLGRGWKRGAGVLWVALLGGACLFQFHRVEFASRFATLEGDRNDTRLIGYLLEHTYQAVRGRVPFASPRMFYPEQGTLGYSEVFLAHDVVFWLLRALGAPMFSAQQGALLLLDVATYLACFALLWRGLRLGVVASSVGAAFFTFNSAKFNQIGHDQLQPLLFPPLLLLCLVELYRGRETHSRAKGFALLSAAGLLLALQLYTSVYVAWFLCFWLLLFAGLSLVGRELRLELRRLGRHWPGLAGALAVTAVSLIPFVALYLPVLRQSGWRSYDQAAQMVPTPLSHLFMGTRNYLWAWLPERFPAFLQLPLWWEHRIGLGLTVGVCWIAAILLCLGLLVRLGRGGAAPAWLGAAGRDSAYVLISATLATALFSALALKYGHGASPWKGVFQVVPGARSIRAVSRYVLVTALPMACVLAFLLDRALGRAHRLPGRAARAAAGAVLAAGVGLGLFEQFGGGGGMSKQGEADRIARLSAKLAPGCDVFYVTADGSTRYPVSELQIDAMLVSMSTGVPTLNGYSGQSPPNWGLWDVRSPDYPLEVQRWIAGRGVCGRVCALPITE